MKTPIKNVADIRVLVVDDSAMGRAAISDILSEMPGVRVVGRAVDGTEALKRVLELGPDLVTLDLEMPRMDGFTLLRMLRVHRPVPVIVVSSDSRPEASLQALELGAIDFVVKPNALTGASIALMGSALKRKIAAALASRPFDDAGRATPEQAVGLHTLTAIRALPERVQLVVIGASTGGPVTLQGILQGLPQRLGFPLIIAQHMPGAFTSAFAERLDRKVQFEVREARDGDELCANRVLIAPGALQSKLIRAEYGGLHVRLSRPEPGSRYTPSVDLLMESAAETVGPGALGIVLTGMGSDGSIGAVAIENAGGYVLTESAQTAVINGMPEEARRVCRFARALRSDQISRLISRLSEESLNA